MLAIPPFARISEPSPMDLAHHSFRHIVLVPRGWFSESKHRLRLISGLSELEWWKLPCQSNVARVCFCFQSLFNTNPRLNRDFS